MKITNVKEKSGSRTTDYFLLVEDENGWKPNSNVDFIQVGLDPYKRYWWQLGKTDKIPAVLDVTIEQAKGLLDKGYSFEVMEASMVKITNIKYGNITFIEDSDGWHPDTTNTRATRAWGIEKYLDPAKKYWSVSVSDKSKPVVAELKFEDAIALKSEGYTFDIVKEDEEMNEGPKFYALKGKYGLVFALPGGFQHGFEAGEVTTRDAEEGGGYIIFTSLEDARRIAGFSRKTDDFDKLQVVEVDPIAKKVIKVVGEPKQTKWRIAWSGGESTPKWFKGNTFDAWSLVTSKSEARDFDTLENAERVVKILGLNGLYVTEDK
jgi:hypothetical protein